MYNFQNLFTYESCDYIDGGLQYFNTVLKTKIGIFEIGSKMEAIAVDLESGTLELYGPDSEGCPVATIPFTVRI